MHCVRKINLLFSRTNHRIIGNRRLFFEEPLVKPFDKPFEKPFDDPVPRPTNPTDEQEKTKINDSLPNFNLPGSWDESLPQSLSPSLPLPLPQPINDYSDNPDYPDFPDITFIVEITKQ
jgi:hypothetical protein